MKPWMWLVIVAGGLYLLSKQRIVISPVNTIPDMPPTDELEPTEGGPVDEEQGFTGAVPTSASDDEPVSQFAMSVED